MGKEEEWMEAIGMMRDVWNWNKHRHYLMSEHQSSSTFHPCLGLVFSSQQNVLLGILSPLPSVADLFFCINERE
jgi:hypothetical protein